MYGTLELVLVCAVDVDAGMTIGRRMDVLALVVCATVHIL